MSGVKGRSGRPVGSESSCSACGESGHNAGRDGLGLCSPTHVAALMVINEGWSQNAAAKAVGIKRQGVSVMVRKMRGVGK